MADVWARLLIFRQSSLNIIASDFSRVTAARSARVAAQRIIAIASVLLVIFLLTIAVPLAQGRITGSIQTGGFTEQYGGGMLYLNGSASVTNGGYYSIDGLALNATLLSPGGGMQFDYNESLPSVPSGTTTSFPISIPVPVGTLYRLFNASGYTSSANFTLVAAIGGHYAMDAVAFNLHTSTGVIINPRSFAGFAGGGAG